MRVEFHANVLGYKSGDIVDLPADTEGLKDAIEGEYVSKVGRSAKTTTEQRTEPPVGTVPDPSAVDGGGTDPDADPPTA